MDIVKGLAASMSESDLPDSTVGGRNAQSSKGAKSILNASPPSPMARVALRTMKARQAAARMHSKVQREKPKSRAPTPVGGNSPRTPTANMENNRFKSKSERRVTDHVLESSRKELGDMQKKKLKQAASDSNLLTQGKGPKSTKKKANITKKRHGVLSSLFGDLDGAKRNKHHRQSSHIVPFHTGDSETCCGIRYLQSKISHFMNRGSVPWHDKRYGRVGKKAQLMQASHTIISVILIWFDNYKMLRDGTDSPDDIRKAAYFYIPSGCSFAMFMVLPVLTASRALAKIGVEDTVALRKKIQACSFVLTVLGYIITELSTGLIGFSDSVVWVIISWIYGFGQYSFRAAFVITSLVTALYILSAALGLVLHNESIGIKVAGLVGLLYIPLSIIFSVIEVQIEKASRMTAKEAEGREQLLEQVAMTEKLLETVLPKAIIPQVKQIANLQDVAIAHTYQCCTICFAKITGIHHLFETQPTVSVLAQVDELYKAIDAETDVHRVEKIKTVGDVYMAASGLPQKNQYHAIIMVDFCFAISRQVHFFAHKWEESKLGFKIGVSSGPIVAGVIGQNKYTYDLWGDAANTASRMYSFGKKGKIQTTESTVELVKSHYRCSERGIVNVKGKGEMMCYFVHGRLPSYTETNMSKHVESEELDEVYISRQHVENANEKDGLNQKKGNLQRIVNEGFNIQLKANDDVMKHLRVGKEDWVADSDSNFCTECGKKFTLTFRRHHCRFCGRLLCSDCTQHKLLKQRACDSCIVLYNDVTHRHVLMHRQQIRRVLEKTRKAEKNFRSPYSSMYHCCRSGTSSALEYEYLVDRKNNVRELVVRCWFFMLITVIVMNQVINEFYLPFKCHNYNTMKEFECDEMDGPITGFSSVGQIAIMSSQGKLDFDSSGKLSGYVPDFLNGVGTETSNQESLDHGFTDVDRREAISNFLTALAATYGANDTNGSNSWGVTHVGEANGGTFVSDNPITVIGYSKAGSNVSIAYGYERMMIVKNSLMFVILPVMVIFLFFSRQEYNIVPRQEWMESQKASVVRDPGKPPPGKYTKQDHLFISLQVALAVTLMLIICIFMSLQSALGGGTVHGYMLIYTVWGVNLFSDVPNFYAFLVTIIGTVCYFIFLLIDMEHNPIGGSSMLTFFIEKYVPVVFVASIAGHKLDTKHRSHFMGQLSHRKTKRDADIEKRKNYNLVPLPPAIRDMMRQAADEGIEDNQIVLDAYGSVLFADIVSFTVFSTNMEPLHLVRVLNEMFSMHDTLAVRLGIDKIKTLGDCYVASTGLLAPTGNHASLLVKFGIGMHDVMFRLNTKFDLHGKGPKGKDLRIRVGVASGPVVGGVVGGKKFLFDIWGDTVEQAELMESEGVPERVHMSESTFLRARKDQDLRFEVDDKTRHEGGKIKDYDKDFSYLAIMPSNIPAWLDELFPVIEKNNNGENGKRGSTIASSVRSMSRGSRLDSYGDLKEISKRKKLKTVDDVDIHHEMQQIETKTEENEKVNTGSSLPMKESGTDIKFEGIPSAEVKRRERDHAARKARE